MMNLGKLLIIIGLSIAALGLLLHFFRHIPLLGKLPGDFVFKKGDMTFYFPLSSCILISIILSIILRIFHHK